MSLLDFNDAPQQQFTGELIPRGTIVKLQMNIRPGGAGPEGMLKESKSSDALMIDAEFTVVDGPFARRKIWQNMVVSGDSVDDNGQSKRGMVTRSTIRAILESSRNVLPTDQSQNAMMARKISSYADLEGMIFIARIGVQKSKDPAYPDPKNQISAVITPDKGKVYTDAMAGIYAAPPATQAPVASNPAPSWAGGQGTAAAPPTAQKPATGPSAVPSWAQ